MESSLLRSKLKIPPAPHRLVSRERLLGALDSSLPTCKLALVCAPAGYGKTTLVAHWARNTALRVGWLTVDSEDNDVETFLRYLYTAWELIQPDIHTSTLGVLLDGMTPNIDAVLAAFINAASELANDQVLVIDDYHLVAESGIHEALTYLIDHLPESLHLVIATREEPPFPVSRYRARQELLELRTDDLQFQREETGAFINRELGLELSDTRIESLQDQAEGWIAGLQLVSLTLGGNGRDSRATITGRHRFIADYLRADVLDRLPDQTRQFLLHTSIVDRMCASLCDVVTAKTNAQGQLEWLERHNLFTMPLDDEREWFRYHRLFTDVLRDELSRHPQDERDELHRRAATWFLRQDMPEQAFDHALAANDIELVVQILERYVQVKMFSGQVKILLAWLHAIPGEWFAIEPLFILFKSAVNVVTGQFDACVSCLDVVEQAIHSTEKKRPEVLARVTAMRCYVACFRNDLAQAESFADVALDTLVAADESYRAGIYGALGDTYRRNGYWAQAHEQYLLALEHFDNPEGFIQAVHAFGALADLELRQGRLRAAADYWRKALARIGDKRLWGAYPLPLIGWVHIRLGEILYEWNDLEAAQDAAAGGRKRAELGGDPRSIIAGGLLAARLHLAHGELDAAEKVVEQLQPMVSDAQFPDWSSEFEHRRVEVWLAQSKLRTAVTWSDDALGNDATRQPDREPLRLALARVLVVKGDTEANERALKLLDREIDAATAGGRTGIEIRARAIRSLAMWNLGDRATALTSLEHALRLAEPEGYIRTFVDLGLPMARLLQEARDRKVMPDYVVRLLSSYDADVAPGLPAKQRLSEPLSARELEVLRKLAAGLTNREIADALFISPETVKKHTGSIYGKLGVRSRMEAVARCRELDLLG